MKLSWLPCRMPCRIHCPFQNISHSVLLFTLIFLSPSIYIYIYMSSDSGEKTLSVKRLLKAGIEPPDTETLQCPRCESINTKFCYYNNYNLSQPRYFCKSCRRYWTRGGTLRNVPVGGGTRKSSAVKRLRATSSSTTAIVTVPAPSSSSTLTHHDHVVLEMPVFNQEMGQQVNELNLNQAVSMVGLTDEFGLGLGVRGLGFEMSPWDWSMGEVAGDIVESGCNTTGGGGGMVVSGGGGACWQVDNGEYYCWSDLAMSTPGNGVK